MMMHPVLRTAGPLGVVLLVVAGLPAQAEARQVSLESLMATADSGLAAARAGVATAGLKLALAEKEMEEQAARERAAAASEAPGGPATGTAPAPVAPSTRSPAPVQEPDRPGNPTAPPPTSADTGGSEAGAAVASSPEDSAAAGSSSDRLNTLLPGPLVAQAIAQAEGGPTQAEASLPAPGGAADPAEPGAPDAITTPEPLAAQVSDPAAAGVPLTDLVGTTLGNGLAGAASMTSDWTTLFRGLVDRHPGLMPALLLLMTAAGATALAVGAGIRPGRRRRAAVGHEGNPSVPAGPRPPRMRPDQRVPRDVAAVLASLEGRRGASPLYGRDPRDGAAPGRHG